MEGGKSLREALPILKKPYLFLTTTLSCGKLLIFKLN